MKWLKYLFFFVVGLLLVTMIVFLLGPRYPYTPFDCAPSESIISLEKIQQKIDQEFILHPNLKPDNDARIMWVDSFQKTKFVILYLHGFSASRNEGFPTHENLAKKYKCNLYLSRLPGHGIRSENPLFGVTAKDYIEYGKKAINEASKLGDHLIVMSTSTGSTISAYLASCDPRVEALVMLAPNFGLADPNFDRLDGPWGEQLFKLMVGGNYWEWSSSVPEVKDYWQTRYRTEAVIVLDQLVTNTMTNTVFEKINIPYYIGYYYKDDSEKDDVISIDDIHRFEKFTSTSKDKYLIKEYPNAKHHPLGNEFHNPNVGAVQKDIEQFLDDVFLK